jgi:N-acyl-D-amino-acid deacylase
MKPMLRGAAAASLLALSGASAPAQQPEFDVLITGGTVIDGTGAQRFRADIALKGDRIALISRSPIPSSRAGRTIDATGKVVSPGFIDMHAHLDPLMQLLGAESAARQGVTFALGGPDGGSPLPLGSYMDTLTARGIGINVGYLVGHNTVKQRVMGTVNRVPTADELRRMKALIAEGMRDGAFGISTGLRYLPGNFSRIEEVIELSKVAADSGGIYTSHLREEGLGLIQGVAEAIQIARDAKIPVVLTHHKAVGQQMWGKSVQTLAMVDSARRRGLDVMVDVYPYTATSTGLGVLIPTWAFDGGDTSFVRRVNDRQIRDSIKKGVVELLLTDRGGGDIARVQFSNVRWQPELNGKTLADWAKQRGMAPTVENGAELVIEGQLKGGASMIYHVLDEADVQRIMKHPQAMIGSDGRLARYGDNSSPHPRAYGTFPRVLGRYARDLKAFPLETAIYKMSGQSAARLGVRDRGVLRAGNFADVVVFDPATVADKSTFEQPHQYSVGIDYVFVNGVAAVDAGRFTDSRAGRVLKRGK